MKVQYRWELVAWLSLAFLLNQADRQIFNVVLPLVKPNLGLSDLQAGLVASVLTFVFAVMIPLAGYAGDSFSRKRIIVFSLLAWSLSTLLTGFASSLLYLIVVRSIATGVGEAFYAPSAYALIAEHHVEHRAQAMAIHQTALYVGVVLSGLVAGYLGDHFGWRSAFWVFGAAGILVVLPMHRRLREPRAVQSRDADRPSISEALRVGVSKPSVVLLALALGGAIFVNVGYLTWMPTYLHERFRLSLMTSGFCSMFFHYIPAFFGVQLGGRLSDRFASERPQFRLEIQAAGLLIAAPFLFLLGTADKPVFTYSLLAGFGFFRGLYDSNIYPSLFEVVKPRLHASATGAVTAFAFVLGALAPVTLGSMKQTLGLSAGISSLTWVYLGAGILICGTAGIYFKSDYVGATGGSKCSVWMAK